MFVYIIYSKQGFSESPIKLECCCEIQSALEVAEKLKAEYYNVVIAQEVAEYRCGVKIR